MSDKISQLVDQVWLAYDTDGSGVLEKNEAQQFINEVCGKGSGLENMKKQLMKLLDADGDNQLTKDELKNVLMSGLEE